MSEDLPQQRSVLSSIAPHIGQFARYVGAITLGIGAPVFEIALQHSGQYPLTILEGVFLALLIELLIPLFLLGLRIAAGRWAPAVDVLVYAVPILSLARVAERNLIEDTSLFWKGVFVVVASAVAALLFARVATAAKKWLEICAWIAPVLVAIFLLEVVQQPGSLMAEMPARRGHPAVVLVVMDELSIYSLLASDGRIDARAFPNFARLQASSIWFRNTTTSYAYTAQSFSSFLSGKENRGDNIRPPDAALTRHLAANGYGINIVSPVFWCNRLNPCRTRESSAFSFRNIEAITRTFAAYLIPFSVLPSMAPSLVLNVIDEEAGHPWSMAKTLTRGNFYLFHTMVTHAPPLYGSDGRLHSVPLHSPFVPFLNHYAPFSAVSAAAMHEQTRFADAWLGRLISAMKRAGVWDDAVLVLIADHGSCHVDLCHRTNPDEIRQPTASLAYVPFFFHAPGLKPRIDDRPAALIDLMPTLLAQLSLKRNSDLTGLDLLGHEPPGDRARRLLLVTSHPPASVNLPPVLPPDGNMRYAVNPISLGSPSR